MLLVCIKDILVGFSVILGWFKASLVLDIAPVWLDLASAWLDLDQFRHQVGWIQTHFQQFQARGLI